MKNIKLAADTINNNDYKIMIDFLKKRKYLNQSKVTEKFQNNFSKYLKLNHSILLILVHQLIY